MGSSRSRTALAMVLALGPNNERLPDQLYLCPLAEWWAATIAGNDVRRSHPGTWK